MKRSKVLQIFAFLLSLTLLSGMISAAGAASAASAADDIIFNLDFRNYDSYAPIKDTVTGVTVMESGLEAMPDYADSKSVKRDGVYMTGDTTANGIQWTSDILDPMKNTEKGFTMNMWVLFIDKQSNTQFFAFTRNCTDTTRNNFIMQVHANNNNSISINTNCGENKTENRGPCFANDNKAYSKTWYMITVTQDPEDNKYYIYINGNDETKQEYKGPASVYEIANTDADTHVATYAIGGRAIWADKILNGVLSSVTMYGRALTAEEIGELYTAGETYEQADYTKVKAALATVPEDLSVYTADSAAAVTEAKNAVIYGLAVSEQERVDAMAAAIEEAVKGLKMNITDTDAEAAAAVDTLIEALPDADALTADDAEKVYAVSTAYAALTNVGRRLVEKAETLLSLEAKLRELGGHDGIDNLVSHDPDNDFNWTVRNNAQNGDQAYNDRRAYFQSLPAELVGADYIRTAMNSKTWNGGETLAEFDVYASTDLYVAWDERIPLPEWLSGSAGYERTDDRLTYTGSSDAVMRFYRRSVAAGEHIKLGVVNSNSACYTVFLKNQTPDAPKEPAPPQRELSRKVKIACIGDSITNGAGASNRDETSYPATLGKLLGDSYEVKNFGISGKSLMNIDSDAYVRTAAYTESLEYDADIVIIMLGTNDSQPRYNSHIESKFKSEYLSLLEKYQALPSNPKIYIATSPYSHSRFNEKPASWDIRGNVIEERILPIQKEIAAETGLEMIDMHAATYRTSYFPDSIHPNDEGYAYMARVFYDALFDYLPEGVTDLGDPVIPADPADFTALDEVLKKAEALDRDVYTDESLAVLDASLAKAEALNREAMDSTDQADIDALTAEIDKAIADLEEIVVPPVDEYKLGDVDKNGTINVSDIMALKNLIMSGQWTDEQLKLGDMDNSGNLTVGDILAIKNVIMSQA